MLTGSVQGTFKKAIVSKIRFTEASNEAELMRIEEGGVRDTGESAIGVIDSATAKRVLTEFLILDVKPAATPECLKSSDSPSKTLIKPEETSSA